MTTISRVQAALAAAFTLVSVEAAAQPVVGAVAPDFSVQDETGRPVKLSDLKGRPVVLYSYPKDDTPGCTTEARAFTAILPRLTALGAVVLGVSGQDADSHRAFKDKHGIGFPLLVDPDRELMTRYGMWRGMLASRTTVLIGPDGKGAAVWPRVDVTGHDQEVLLAVEQLVAARAASKPAVTR